MKRPLCSKCVLLMTLVSGLCGCGHTEAPSFDFFGAFFPAWMLCALAGIAGAIGARAVLVTPGLQGTIPYLLPVCASVGVVVGVSVWLLFFR